VTLAIVGAVAIPKKLLIETDGNFRFASRSELSELSGDEWAALQGRARQGLAQPFRLSLSADGQSFFGLRVLSH
jgi:hypothetical protein